MKPGADSFRQSVDPGLTGRAERAGRVLSLMNRLHAREVFDTAEHRADFVATISYEKLKEIGMLVNDVMRNKPRSQEFDGTNVRVETIQGMTGASETEYLPPDAADKEGLLKEVLDGAKSIDIKRAALLIASGINAVHPFADGNGRLSRLMYVLLAEGYDESDKAQKRVRDVLGQEGREYVDPNPDFIAHYLNYLLERGAGIKHGDPLSVTESWSEKGMMFGDLTPASLQLSVEADPPLRRQILEIVQDKQFRTLVFFLFLKDHDMLREPYIAHKESEGRYERYKRPDKWTTVQIDEVLKSLNDSQIKELLDTSRNIRKLSVQLLVRVFTTPEQFKLSDGGTIEEYFAREVEQSKRQA